MSSVNKRERKIDLEKLSEEQVGELAKMVGKQVQEKLGEIDKIAGDIRKLLNIYGSDMVLHYAITEKALPVPEPIEVPEHDHSTCVS